MTFRNFGITLHLNRCAALQKLKKIKMRTLRCDFTGWKDPCALLRCTLNIMLFVPTSGNSSKRIVRMESLNAFSALSILIILLDNGQTKWVNDYAMKTLVETNKTLYFIENFDLVFFIHSNSFLTQTQILTLKLTPNLILTQTLTQNLILTLKKTNKKCAVVFSLVSLWTKIFW